MGSHDRGKRKRSFSDSAQSQEAKRTAITDSIYSEASSTKGRQRQKIKVIYESYLLLCSKSRDGDVGAFELLLHAVKGSQEERRLASVLIPKFAERILDMRDAAVSALIDLSKSSAASEDESHLAEASGISALQGLGVLCKAAAKLGHDIAVFKGVEYLLRELYSSKRSMPDTETRDRALDEGKPSLSRKTAAIISSLIIAFREAPQNILSVCLRGLQKGHGDFFQASKHFISDILLRPAEGDLSSAVRPGRSEACPSGDRDSGSAISNCVAAEVLQSVPSVLEWIQEIISNPLKGTSSSTAATEIVQAFTQFLQSVPPLPSGRKKSQGLEPGLAVSPAQPKIEMQPSLSLIPNPLADHQDAPQWDRSVSQAEASPLEASGQNDLEAPDPFMDGVMAVEGVKPPAIKINPEQVRPGGEVCMASPILWLTGIPTSLPDTAITAECSSFGAVLDVLQPTAPPHDEAFVMFADIRDAACCYEAMCDAPVWCPQRVNVRFCEHTDPASSSGGDEGDSKVHVWVGGVGSSRGEEGVLRRLTDERVPPPVSILRVAGRRPGLMLQYTTAAQGATAVRALARDGPPPGRMPSVAEAPVPQPGPFAGGASRTLWVGQVGPAVTEDRLIAGFREYGMVTGWKFLRRSNCAFIDFDSPASAAAALEALHGANFNGCQIRIEFKDERGNSGPHPGGRGPPLRGTRFAPATHSPGRGPPGWMPMHRSAASRGFPSPVRRPSYGRDNSPRGSWPVPAASDPALSHAFQDRRGSSTFSGALNRGRSFADDNLPRQLQVEADLPERPSTGVHGRRPSRLSKWDVQAGFTAEAQQPEQNAAPRQPANLQRKSSVEEGQIAIPPVPMASAPQPSSTGVRWRGMLAKSGSPVCSMICTTESSSSGDAREPQGWPSTLDVTVRVDLSYVLSNVSAMSAVLCLTPAVQPNDRRQRAMFIDLINNLSSRSRAGVVKNVPPIDASAGLRSLYLVPPSVSVAERLRVVWDHKECVFAMVMPASFK